MIFVLRRKFRAYILDHPNEYLDSHDGDFSPMSKSAAAALICMITHLSGLCNATVLSFEDFTAPGTLTNINPAAPYEESGFTITPTDGESAVFDSAFSTTMIGNDTDWFGFGESNTPSLTLTSSSLPFNLVSLLAGPNTLASGPEIDLVIIGTPVEGDPVTVSFPSLSTATLLSPNWTNLTRVDFTSSDDAGIDDIDVTVVPEPSTFLLITFGFLGLAWRRSHGT